MPADKERETNSLDGEEHAVDSLESVGPGPSTPAPRGAHANSSDETKVVVSRGAVMGGVPRDVASEGTISETAPHTADQEAADTGEDDHGVGGDR